MQPLAVVNCDVYTGDSILRQGVVLIEGSRIRALGPSESTPLPPATRLIDAQGGRITPGLLDLAQPFPPVQGCLAAPERGVTSYLPAINVVGDDDLPVVARAAVSLARTNRATRPLGLHIIAAFDPALTFWQDAWLASDAAIRLVTYAPDMIPDATVIQFLQARGVKLLAASDATLHRLDAPFGAALDSGTILASGERVCLQTRSLRQLMAATGCDFFTALRCVTCHPADLLAEALGRIVPHAPADLICWTRFGDLAWTMRNGRFVYPAQVE